MKLKSKDEFKTELFLGNLLRAGVTAAAVLTAIGGVLYIMAGAATPSQYRIFRAEPDGFSGIMEILSGVLMLNPVALIKSGILVLVATPIIRVIVSVFVFAIKKDLMYVFITAVVLAVLLYSIMAG